MNAHYAAVLADLEKIKRDAIIKSREANGGSKERPQSAQNDVVSRWATAKKRKPKKAAA